MGEKFNSTLRELIIGNIIYGGIATIISSVIFPNNVKILCGIWIGVLLASLGVWHMQKRISTAIDSDLDENALNIMRAGTLTRNIVLLASCVLIYYTNIANMVAVVVGIFILKLSAYSQPVIHKAMKRGGA